LAVIEVSIFGGRRIQDFYKTARNKAIDDMMDALSTRLGERAGRHQIGQIFLDVITKKKDIRKQVTDPLWQRVDEVMAPHTVYLGNLHELVDPLATQMKAGRRIFTQEAKVWINDIAKQGAEVDWMLARGWKEGLSRDLRLMTKELGKNDHSVKIMHDTLHGLQEALEGATKNAGGKAPKLWDEVNKLYKSLSVDLNKKFIKQLVRTVGKKNPEYLTEAVFTKGNVTNIGELKGMLGPNSNEWGLMKRWYLESVIKKATNEATQELGGISFSKQLSALGDDTLQAIYSPQEYKALKDVATTLAFLERRQAGGTGKVFMQLKQAGAIGDIAGLGLFGFGGMTGNRTALAAGGAILFLPAVASRMFTNPKMAQALIYGLKTPRTSPHVLANMMRAMGLAREAEKMVRSEDAKLFYEKAKKSINIFSEGMP
jgi:hypothetical protein